MADAGDGRVEDDGAHHRPRVMVVGVGNVLHGDDGFGVAVARRLADDDSLPPGVHVTETGIGGIHMVHELMAGYDAMIVVDAVDRGRPPGTVMVIDAEVIDVGPMSVEQRHDLLADMHLATPERALMVAKAVGVLPDRTIIIGCQPVQIETLGIGLTHQVANSIEAAIDEIHRCILEFTAEYWAGHPAEDPADVAAEAQPKPTVEHHGDC